ncbi:MAG TPA: hypothetical protein VLA34_08290, partial [Candidatus Krumholzibacterium sp.]|nr:hypothetical protein [Candidatus Krumholzibacterium sp.]
WREETPGKLVDMSIKSSFRSRGERSDYLRMLVSMIGACPLAGIAAVDEVAGRTASFREEEAKMLGLVEESSFFLDEDERGELVILDLTRYRTQPRVQRNLAYIVHPDSLGVVSIGSVFKSGTKTNDLSLSISLSMNLTGREHGKDAGEIMRSLNIGDGHAGAAGGSIRCGSKEMMLREKEAVLREIWELWKRMPSAGPENSVSYRNGADPGQ